MNTTLQLLINAGCTPETNIQQALEKAAAKYGPLSHEYKEVRALLYPSASPLKLNPVIRPQYARISGSLGRSAAPVHKPHPTPKPLSPTGRLIQWLEANIDYKKLIPDHFVSLNSIKGAGL